MYSYYIERGLPHTAIEALDEHEYRFYLASMLAWEDRRKAETKAKFKWWERVLGAEDGKKSGAGRRPAKKARRRR